MKIYLTKILWFFFALCACVIGLYPFIHTVNELEFGLFNTKSIDILNSSLWNLAFYTHIFCGGIALFIGWAQFAKQWRRNRIQLHRNLGRLYIYMVMLSGIAGIYIAFYASGGWVSQIGFLGLGIGWLWTTTLAYRAIRQQKINDHFRWMTYSYALCFAAVTLRIYLPVLETIFHDFYTAYRIVAWLAWVPNLIIAYFLIKWQRVSI